MGNLRSNLKYDLPNLAAAPVMLGVNRFRGKRCEPGKAANIPN